MTVPNVPKVPTVPKVPSVPKINPVKRVTYDGEEPFNSSNETEEVETVVSGASASGSLNGLDWKKIGSGAILAGIGAAVTAIAEYLGGVDFGPYKTVVMAAGSIFANIVRKLVAGK